MESAKIVGRAGLFIKIFTLYFLNINNKQRLYLLYLLFLVIFSVQMSKNSAPSAELLDSGGGEIQVIRHMWVNFTKIESKVRVAWQVMGRTIKLRVAWQVMGNTRPVRTNTADRAACTLTTQMYVRVLVCTVCFQ